MAEQKKSSTKRKSTAKTELNARSKRAEKEVRAKTGSKVRDEISSIIIIAIGVLLLLAIQTTKIGIVGAILHDFFFGCFGILAYVLPYYLIMYGILLFLNKTVHITGRSFTLMMLIFCMAALLNSARYIDEAAISFGATALKGFYTNGIVKESGGFIGMLIGSLIAKAIGKTGLVIFAIVGIIVCLLLIINTPITQFLEDAKVKRIERRIHQEEELEAYEKEKAERRAEARVEERYAEMNREKKAAEERAKQHGVEAAIAATAASAEERLSSYDKAKIAKGRENILDLMNTDNLFGEGEGSGMGSEGYGLEAAPAVAKTSDIDGIGRVNTETGEVYDEFGKVTEGTMGAAEKQGEKLSKKEAANAMLSQEEINNNKPSDKPYKFPPVELLNKSKSISSAADNALKARAAKLEETLRNFNVDAKVVAATQGPAVTRYEIQPSVGVKVSKITGLADDIALNLEAKSIRIEAPIPGKAAVGIEVENDKINVVNLRDIIESKEFKSAKSKISFAVGKDIAGNAIVGDLKSMPHLLIAGSTGSGKSVCVNSIILSILYKAKPEEVKLVLIDPKVVELGNYNGIPHLLIPVVTEPAKAAAALNWAVVEMDDRYRKFAEVEVRDLESYNDYVRANQEPDLVLPQVVIIIDELADLMMAAPSQVEESICRLAQKARAAGMHLIVATQRPSVDVVTGLIKANVPSRIAFAVSSQIDSRVILDKTGAEKLVGKGDMLYNPLGMGQPIRVQGTFVSDGEVHKVLEHVKAQGVEAEYSSDVIKTIDNGGANAPASDDSDELLSEAIETVVSTGQASVSMLQRRFRIGYNRAARIVDMMEARGIIGPADGSRPRQVLMTIEEFNAIKAEGTEKE
jgi:S-DNA-T family DNA segregation ATPase FtsK/SpoIIIE